MKKYYIYAITLLFTYCIQSSAPINNNFTLYQAVEKHAAYEDHQLWLFQNRLRESNVPMTDADREHLQLLIKRSEETNFFKNAIAKKLFS